MDCLQIPSTHRSPCKGTQNIYSNKLICLVEFYSFLLFLLLLQSLKRELDSLLEEKISNPAPVDWNDRQSKDCAVITAIIDLITTQEKPTGGSKNYDRTLASAPRGKHMYFNDEDDDDDD